MTRLSHRRSVLAAISVLAAAFVMPANAQEGSSSLLDAAINAAGGEAALEKVKELYWTGTATVAAGGKSTRLETETIVRPFDYVRTSSWPEGKDRASARTVQAQFGSVWDINGSYWTPMPDARAEHETQQFSLYSMMLLVGLKSPDARVEETARGKDGARTLHVEHPDAPPMDLRFNSSGRLVQAAYSVRDPDGGDKPLQQVATFSGTITSNGVNWPKQITIRENGAPHFEITLSEFEARPEHVVVSMPQTMAHPPGGG